MSLKLAFSAVLCVVLFAFATSQASDEGGTPSQTASPSTAKTEKKPSQAPEGPTADCDLFEVEKQILEKTNAQRARYGLPPLVPDRNLIQTARSHDAWMTTNRTPQHTSRPVAENIAMGQRTTDEAVGAWMSSSGHRANILGAGYRRTGVAAYITPEGTIYWCQQFMP